jgi:hypothetical protein
VGVNRNQRVSWGKIKNQHHEKWQLKINADIRAKEKNQTIKHKVLNYNHNKSRQWSKLGTTIAISPFCSRITRQPLKSAYRATSVK